MVGLIKVSVIVRGGVVMGPGGPVNPINPNRTKGIRVGPNQRIGSYFKITNLKRFGWVSNMGIWSPNLPGPKACLLLHKTRAINMG